MLFCLPVIVTATWFTYRWITMSANGFNIKATFIYINSGIALIHKAIKHTFGYSNIFF